MSSFLFGGGETSRARLFVEMSSFAYSLDSGLSAAVGLWGPSNGSFREREDSQHSEDWVPVPRVGLKWKGAGTVGTVFQPACHSEMKEDCKVFSADS